MRLRRFCRPEVLLGSIQQHSYKPTSSMTVVDDSLSMPVPLHGAVLAISCHPSEESGDPGKSLAHHRHKMHGCYAPIPHTLPDLDSPCIRSLTTATTP